MIGHTREIALALSVGALSWLLVGALRLYALRRGILDTPKDRSSHRLPTPRGGGAGLIAAATMGYLVAAPAGGLDFRLGLALLAIVPTAVAGWIDDRRALPVLPRFLAHLASGILILPLAIGPGVPFATAVVLGIGWLLATVSAINVVNFVDGIDGLIGLQAAVFAAHLVALAEDRSAAELLGVALAAASVGFLVWNWAPARIFLGDVGSGSVAILGLVGAILVWRSRTWPFIAIFLPLFPIFLDAATAIVRRLRQGERLTVAHRNHLYLRLANERGWGHSKVSLLYGALSAAAIALVTVSDPGLLPFACITFVAGVVLLGWILDRSCPVAKIEERKPRV